MTDEIIRKWTISALLSHPAWTYLYFLITFLSMTCVAAVFILIPLSFIALCFHFLGADGIEFMNSDDFFTIIILIYLGLVGLFNKHLLNQALDFDVGSEGKIGLWVSSNAWVSAHIVLSVSFLAQAFYFIVPGQEGVAIKVIDRGFAQSFLYSLDIIAAAIFFDVFDVFQIRMSDIHPTSTLGRSFNLLARTVISLTVINFFSRTYSLLKSHNREEIVKNMGKFDILWIISLPLLLVNFVVWSLWFLGLFALYYLK